MIGPKVSAETLLAWLRADPAAYEVTETNASAVAELESRGIVRTETHDEFYGRRRGGREFVRTVKRIVLIQK